MPNYSIQEIEQAVNAAALDGRLPGAMRFLRVAGFCVWRRAHYDNPGEGTWRCFLVATKGLGDINTVAQTIQTIEGWYPGSVSYTNNNPGNLKYAGQPGATQGANGFAVFPNYVAGYQALVNQIDLDASRGQTIAQFTSIYAPASDNNNPTSYAAQIANAAGVSVNDPLSLAISSDGSLAESAGDGDGDTDSSALASTSTSATVSILGMDVPVTYLVLGIAAAAGLLLMALED